MKNFTGLNAFVCVMNTILRGGVICIALISCNNIFDGGDFKEQLDKDIAYAKAKSLPVIISPEEGTGSTIPFGSQTVKQGYPFEVSFSEASGYSFVKWIAVSKENSSIIIEEGVVFDEPSSPKTNATIKINSEDVRIVPYCVSRIAVAGEPNPKYDANGVSRDRPITVEFTRAPSASSFIFSDSELPEGASPVSNSAGEIWAYELENQTYLKNISITNADGISLAQHFCQPVIDGTLVTVAVDKTKPIEFETGVVFKTVKVSLSPEITDFNGVSMNAEKSWRYQITEATDEKATVNLSGEAQEGSVYLAGTKDYSLGQKLTLSFTENADYQFVRWDYNNEVIYVAEPDNANTTATVIDKTTESNPTQIKAVCAPRLRISSFSPVNDSVNPSVSKNSSIIITFTQDLPSDEEGLKQLENIQIAVGGSPVRSSFLSPSVNAATVTFAANMSNMLDVPNGQTKTVTVSIPADFYYMTADGTKVTYGGTGKSFDYKIDSTTLQKAEITFAASASSGSLSPASGTTAQYSIGQGVEFSFAPAEGYKFSHWQMTDAQGNSVPESKITIEDKKSLSTKLYVYDAVPGVTVSPVAVLVPQVTSVTPAYSNVGVECDTPIVITFNKAVDQNTVNLSSDGTIQIVDSGNENEHYESKFKSMDWSTDGKTLTIRTDRTIQTLVPSETDLKALKIKVIYAQIKDPDGNPLEKDPSCVYKINGKMETEPPEVTMNLYKQGFDIQKDSAGEYAAIENGSYTALSASEFSTFAANDYPKNHVGKKIYFDAAATDSGSGYKQLTIQETLIRTVDAAVTNQACKPSEPYTAATITKQVYELQSTMDGAVQLDFIFEDWAGNKTTKSWYVIKDTTIADTVVEKDNQNYILTSKWQTPDKVSDTKRPIYYYLNHELTNDYVYSRVADSTENYKEIIKFSKTDNYYSGRSEYADYVIKWGYSENNITNTADKEFDRVFSFTRSIKDTCFVKIICYDVVGNTKTLMVKIPKKTQLTGFDSGTFYGFTYYKPTYMNKADNAVLFYKYKENEDSELSEIRYFGQFGTSENSVISMPDFMTEDYYFKDETLTPDGIYYFYIIPYYEYGSIRYYGTVSKPYIYYHNVDNLSQNLQIPAFPTTFSYSINDEKPDSSGVRHIKVSLPESFEPTPGYTYGVSFGSRGSLNEFDFTVSSGKKYQTYIGAVDANGNFYNSDYNVLIDATYDNIPPNWDEKTNGYISNYFSAPNEILIGNKWGGSSSWFPYDSGSGLKQINRNGSDLNVFNYYYTKFETTLPDNKLEHFSNEVVLNISREELKNLEKNTLEYDPTASQIKLEFNQSVEGYYFLILELEDKKGNYSILSGFVSNMVVAKLPKLTVSGTTTSDYTITIDTNSLRGWSYKLLFDNCYLSDDEWTIQNRLSNSNSSYNLKIKYDFLRIALNGKRNSLYAFYNPEYYIKQNAGENPVCNSKAVIPGLGGSYQVFYDAPCFAHTMAFPTNMLSDLDAKLAEAKSIDSSVDDETYIKAIWETKGREYGLKLINSSWLTSASTATYTAPVSEIPSGYSYVTVFHFADGTSVMSEVKSR